MHAVYVFRHSKFDDIEIKMSLRSIETYAPFISKVWIFGDKPEFICDDTTIIEHVPAEYMARLLNVKTPVRSMFLLMTLSSMIPELSQEYLLFCDDFILLNELTPSVARRVRFIEDLRNIKVRGKGLYLDSLWRTFDLLTRLGYSGLNFEAHTPMYLQRKWVFEAYCDFQDFVTEDRFQGMLGSTAILNHGFTKKQFGAVNLHEENSRAGFWKQPPTLAEVESACATKLFLNFDDEAFGPSIQEFLEKTFPTLSRFEQTTS